MDQIFKLDPTLHFIILQIFDSYEVDASTAAVQQPEMETEGIIPMPETPVTLCQKFVSPLQSATPGSIRKEFGTQTKRTSYRSKGKL